MSFLLELGLLILGAKVLGEAAERIKLPSILGYIAAGIFLGPIHHIVTPSPEITVFAQLGALLLLFVAGIRQIRLDEVMRNPLATVGVSFLGYLFPFVAVLFIASNAGNIVPGMQLSLNEMLIMAAALSTSAIVTSVKTLISINKLESEGSRILLGASILDSFIGLFVFTVVITFATTSFANVPRALGITALTLAFFLIFYLAEKALPAIIAKSRFLEVEEAQFTMVFVVMLGLVWLAEAIGLNGIIGAFFAGIIVSKTKMRESAFYEKIASLTYGIFVPIFFAWAGLLTVPEITGFVVLVALAVAASNILGAYFGAALGGLSEKESLLVGVGMIPRGGIDLVIVTAGMTLGLLSDAAGDLVFSTIVMTVIATILITPLLLFVLFRPETSYA